MSAEKVRASESTSKKYAVLVKIRAPAGVSIYHPLATTAAPSYPLPPPTTLAGALAYSYLRTTEFTELVEVEKTRNTYSPTILILDKIAYAAAGAEGWMLTKDIERVYQLIYQRMERWGLLELAYTVGVRGNTYYPNDRLYLLYILKDEELAKHAYGITRIGRKENLVSVEDIIIEELSKVIKSVGSGTFKTYFYLPEEIAVCTNHEIISLPKLTKENFGTTTSPATERYCVSKGLGAVRGELKSSGVLIEIDDFEIPVPRQVMS
ncbi:MAG: type I-A CRISPR-associated protein Cas5a [Zestosphaera sp.]